MQFDSPCDEFSAPTTSANIRNDNSISSISISNSNNNGNINNSSNKLLKDKKFAALTAALDDMLIDDETSPSDSLISSTASDDLSVTKKKELLVRKKVIEAIKDGDEKDINDVSPIFEVASPISHGTPTHATNSFSFSDGDGGRDFLIDDEIADQPVLCFGDNHGNPNDSFAHT